MDIILGGHDHFYYISKGVTSWDGYDVNQEVLGAEEDNGDVLIVKSGTDFRDLSEFTLELEDTPEGSVRKKLIRSIRGASDIQNSIPDSTIHRAIARRPPRDQARDSVESADSRYTQRFAVLALQSSGGPSLQDGCGARLSLCGGTHV